MKIIKVIIFNTILRPYIINQSKPYINKVWIFAGGSLEIIYAIWMHLELFLLYNKPAYPASFNASAVALFEKKIGHIFNTSDPGRKSSLVQIQNVLNNRVFFGFR